MRKWPVWEALVAFGLFCLPSANAASPYCHGDNPNFPPGLGIFGPIENPGTGPAPARCSPFSKNFDKLTATHQVKPDPDHPQHFIITLTAGSAVPNYVLVPCGGTASYGPDKPGTPHHSLCLMEQFPIRSPGYLYTLWGELIPPQYTEGSSTSSQFKREYHTVDWSPDLLSSLLFVLHYTDYLDHNAYPPGSPNPGEERYKLVTIPLYLGKAAAEDIQKKAGNEGPSIDGEKESEPGEDAGEPVDLFSGAYYSSSVDLMTPGIIPVKVNRYYTSAFANEDGPFGKGSALLPYAANVVVKKDSNGMVTTAPGTELVYSTGDHTTVTFKDEQGNLQFTATGQTGFAGNGISVQKDAAGLMNGAILNKPNGDKFLFDANGDLIKIQDRNNNAVEITRDANKKITRIQEPSAGKGIDFTYDANNHITQVTGLNGQTASYQYDDQGRLSSVTDPGGHTGTYTYDNDGQVIVATDPRGTQIVQNTYNADGRVTHQVLGDGNTVDIEYPNDTIRRVTDGNGHTQEHRFNGHGLFVGYKTPLNQEYIKTHSPAFFDNSGGPRTITSTDPLGRTVTTEFNAFNQPVRMTDQSGRVTEFSYESTFHLLASIKDPLGRITRFDYDAAGNVMTATDPDGNASSFTYNAQGQVLTATDSMGQKMQYVYNPAHDLIQMTDPLGHKTTYTYDNLSRLTKVTDAKGNKTSYAYDILNRVTEITDALGHKTAFAYDENGNVISVTDPRGNTSTSGYDVMNRLTSVTNAKGETATITYDGADNVTSVTDPKGQTTTFTYDANDRKTRVQYGDGTTYTYDYDVVDRLTKISDGTGNWIFVYDILNRLITENTPQGSLNYTYDPVSRLTGFSSPNTGYAPVQMAYDNLDRITSIMQNGKTYSYAYDTLGRRTGLNRPNGVTSSYEYDASSRLMALSHSKGTQVLEKHDYTYDANGNVVKYIRGKGTSQPVVIKPCGKNGKGQIRKIVGYITDKAEELNRNYTYDALNRLTGVNGLGMVPSASEFKNSGNKLAAALLIEQAKKIQNPNSRNQLLKNAEKLGAVLPESANWTFDENGNILTKTVHETDGDKLFSYAYDDADRMIELVRPLEDDHDRPNRGCRRHPKFKHGPRHRHSCRLPQDRTETIDFTYDANGNLTGDETGRTFTWNAQNQLVRLQTEDSTASFTYDPLERRVSFAKGATTKSYFYRGLSLLSDGKNKYLDGIGLDGHLQVNNANGSQSFLQDHLGSTSHLLDSANGNSKTRYDYKSYGKLEGDVANSSLTNPYTYTGREDDGTGLMYYRARYYDPDLEIFISQDPLGDAMRYVGGNPLTGIDPLGLAVLFTDMTNGTTTFYPWPEKPNWPAMTIPTLNESLGKKGSNDPFRTSDVNWRPTIPSSNPNCKGVDAHVCYGPDGSYIDVHDIRSRDIHGGGRVLGETGSQVPVQSLKPTMGCTRGHNRDVRDLGQYIDDFKKATGANVPYVRSLNPQDINSIIEDIFRNYPGGQSSITP